MKDPLPDPERRSPAGAAASPSLDRDSLPASDRPRSRPQATAAPELSAALGTALAALAIEEGKRAGAGEGGQARSPRISRANPADPGPNREAGDRAAARTTGDRVDPSAVDPPAPQSQSPFLDGWLRSRQGSSHPPTVGSNCDRCERRRDALRYRDLLERLPAIAYRLSLKQGGLYYSGRVRDLLGYAPETLVADPWLWHSLIHPDDRERVFEQAAACRGGGEAEVEYRIRDAWERWHWFRDRFRWRPPTAGEDGEGEIEGLALDITERHQAEDALRRSEAQLKTILENTTYGFAIVDRQGIIRFANPATAALFACSPEALVGREFGIPISSPGPVEVELLRPGGTPLTVDLRTADIEWDGEPLYAVSLQDITDRKQAEDQLHHTAFYDALTGLPNRKLLLERLEKALQRAQRHPDYRFAVLFLDLDRFKLVNDSLGHLVGDALLVGIAQRLQAIVRPTDTISRLGGDEFTVLLEDIDSVLDATRVADRIGEELAVPFELEGHPVFATASIGILLAERRYLDGRARPEDLLRDADTALYRAKERGKARYEIFDRAMHAEVLDRLCLERDLRRALDRGEIHAYYQPIVALDGGELLGFEALARWEHPQRGLVAAPEFVAVAEEMGAISALGERILAEACTQMANWRWPGSDRLVLSVNLSGRQLREPNLLERVDRILADAGLDGRRLQLELTESTLIDDRVEEILARLHQLRSRGIRLSIDDFGTGYSSLSYLHRFPVNSLKIDRSFVCHLGQPAAATDGTAPRDRSIVGAIVALAQQLDLTPVAEGIETRQQCAALRALGCAEGQGFWFARPLPAEAVPGWVAASARVLPLERCG